jgi:hypothetical protein
MIGYEVSAPSWLFLQNSLKTEAKGTKHRQDPTGGGGRPKRNKAAAENIKNLPAPAWWTKNLNVVQAWLLPKGNTYPDYFDTRIPDKKANVDSSLIHTTETHNPAHNPLRILSRLTHLLKNSLSSLTY